MAAADASGDDGLKKRALVRLAIAGGVTAVALAGLWWLDRQGQEAPVAPPTAPKPIVSAPPPEPLPPPAEAEAVPVPPPEPATPAETTPPAGAATKAATPPSPAAPRLAPSPPRVSNDAALPARSTQPAPERPSMPSPDKPHAAALPQERGGGYVVRMGVFSNPANAQELVRRLKAQGIRAQLETRVHVGPFLNRQEADKARAEMQRLGFQGVVTSQ